MSRSMGESRMSGTVMSLTVTVAVLAAVALTMLGLGVSDKAVAVYDASSWVWSSRAGELGRVNGVKGSVDTRMQIKESQGHEVDVVQNDRYLLMRDLVTGKVSSIDLSTLRVSANMDSSPGYGVSLALHGDAAFIVDSVQGTAHQVDPLTLNPTGQPLRFAPGLRYGGFDDTGELWLAVPRDGTVIAVRPGGKGREPTVSRTIHATEPQHDIVLSVLDRGVAVLDQTAANLATIRDGAVASSVPLPFRAPGVLPGRTTGDKIPITVPDERRVYVVGQHTARDFEVRGERGGPLRPAVAWAGWFYVADTLGEMIYVIDGAGNPVDRLRIKDGAGLQFDVRENHLFINPPHHDTAIVIDRLHKLLDVPKFPPGVPGGPPLVPEKPPPSTPPPPPTPAPPGAPSKVAAVAGDGSATVSWGPAKDNLAPITKYVIEGGASPIEVGASRQTMTVTGLTNGTTYTFRVHAVNAKGAGPPRAANPVTPTSQVPDPPTTVTAREAADGTVTVNWTAANGQGHRIAKYTITAVSGGAGEGGAGTAETIVGESTSTELTLADRRLTYGTQYAFTVVAVNDINALSEASALSNTVVPYTKPTTVADLNAAPDTGRAGTITVTWGAAAGNGRPIIKYTVTANGQRQPDTTATTATLTGFAEGATVKVDVSAVNLAGDGPISSDSAITIKRPALTGGHPSPAGPFSIDIPFTVNDGGSPTSCWVDGAVSGSGSCDHYRFGELRPGTDYAFTVHAKNAAGEVSWNANVKTADLWGTVCPDCTSIEVKTQPCYQNPDGGSTGPGCANAGIPHSGHVADAGPNTRYTAICKRSTQVISSAGHQYNRRSPLWIRVNVQGGQGWIPWAWFKIDGDDASVNSLPGC